MAFTQRVKNELNTFFLIAGEAQKEMESVSGSRATGVDDETESVFSGHMIQAVFSMIWSTVVMELWKRRRSTLSYRWGTLNLAERFAEPRPGFHGELGVNPVTRRMEPLFPGWQRDLRMGLVSVPVVGLFLGRSYRFQVEFNAHKVHTPVFSLPVLSHLLLQDWWYWV